MKGNNPIFYVEEQKIIEEIASQNNT